MNIPKSIKLQTRLGSDIFNELGSPPSTFEINQARRLEQKYPNVTNRTQMIHEYNCHGMTFGSRRTWIFEYQDLRTILEEDGYEEILDFSNVLPGDVIIYEASDGDFIHSGIVLEPPKKENLNIPLVLSKWGKFREIIHNANECEYPVERYRYFRVTH